MATEAGRTAMSEHRLSIEFVNDVVDAIAGCIAAGEDLVIARRNSRLGRAATFLAERGNVEIIWDLVRPSKFAKASCSGNIRAAGWRGIAPAPLVYFLSALAYFGAGGGVTAAVGILIFQPSACLA